MYVYDGFGISVALIAVAVIFISLAGIGSSLLLGFCVYYDALYRRVENAVMWAVLSGFFELAALIYLILQLVKKPQPMRCIQCGEFLAPGGLFCARCGRPLNVPSPEQIAAYDRKRRLFLWLWIASVAIIIVVSIIFAAFFVSSCITNISNY